MSYCWGCQPFFVKVSYTDGCFTLAFPSKEAAIVNAWHILNEMRKTMRASATVVNRKDEVVWSDD